ncbi:MAG TPA: J domain-containing protein [Polyangiaceae bacterium]|nr:J domain-containing protein [Polyangiaceae bacterium]
MDFAEALLALGVGGKSEWETLSADALKRAYLKKVRAHPPERDPEGFRRVREAYEFLRALEPAPTAVRDAAPITVDTISAASAPPAPERESGELELVPRANEPKRAQEREPTQSAFARLQQALTHRQYDTAADSLLEIYASAPLARPELAPQLVLSVITKQFVGDSHDRGRRLLSAFEKDSVHMHDPLSERVAALWKLLAELVAIPEEVPPDAVRALARGIESGDFEDATEALRAEVDERGKQRQVELESALLAAAPTLYRAAWPQAPGKSRKQQKYEEGWAVYMFLAMVVATAGYSLTLVESGPARQARESRLAAASASNRSPERDSTPDTTNGRADLGALGPEQSKELEAVTLKLEKVLRFSRCQQLSAVWDEYASVVRGLKNHVPVMQQYEEHRSNAMTTCRVLPNELPE